MILQYYDTPLHVLQGTKLYVKISLGIANLCTIPVSWHFDLNELFFEQIGSIYHLNYQFGHQYRVAQNWMSSIPLAKWKVGRT